MVDYYWLKSFTEILQLFIAVLFLIYIRVKYAKLSPLLIWLSVFLAFKCLEDLYGVINYTKWIETLLTRELLDFYRLFMASLELGMLAAYVLFSLHLKNPTSAKQRSDLIAFIPALVIAPINLVLVLSFESNLLFIFMLIRLIFIGTLTYLLQKTKQLMIMPLTISMLLWNVLWLSEVVLHEQLSLISESTSWVLFILSEISFTCGITYFLIQVIAKPKVLRTEEAASLPKSLIASIEMRLNKAMREDCLYRNADLTLPKLAEQIQLQPQDLRAYINRIQQKNFNQYITDFRVNESMQLLADRGNDFNIEQVMYQVGFNSKSVFNTAFKKQTGVTPSEFRKTHQ